MQQFAAQQFIATTAALACVASTLGMCLSFSPILGLYPMCQRLRLRPPSRNRADLAADALSFSFRPKLPQLAEQLSGQWHGPCQQAPIILMMPMAGRNLTPPPGQGAEGLGLLAIPCAVSKKRRHCRWRHASRPSMFGLTLECESTKRSSTRTSPTSSLARVEARHDDRLPELADFLLVQQWTRRGEAMSEVSRQATHGEWKALSNQGSLGRKPGKLSQRLSQKQCMCKCKC